VVFFGVVWRWAWFAWGFSGRVWFRRGEVFGLFNVLFSRFKVVGFDGLEKFLIGLENFAPLLT
jgi:hypothetical protein